MWVNANGERKEKFDAQAAAAEADLQRRGVVIAECPHCGTWLEVRLDGTPCRCVDDQPEYDGCGRLVTISE